MKLFSATACVAGTVMSLAAPVRATEQYHTSTLQWIYPVSTGDFVLGFETSSSACTNPQSPKYMYVTVGQNGVTVEGAKKIYAAALVAFALGKSVSIAFDDATIYCYLNRLTVNK